MNVEKSIIFGVICIGVFIVGLCIGWGLGLSKSTNTIEPNSASIEIQNRELQKISESNDGAREDITNEIANAIIRIQQGDSDRKGIEKEIDYLIDRLSKITNNESY